MKDAVALSNANLTLIYHKSGYDDAALATGNGNRVNELSLRSTFSTDRTFLVALAAVESQ